MILNINPLKQAYASLNRALERSIREPGDLEVRDACIQRFEYTYELCIKMLKRYLEMEMPLSQQVDQLNYRDLLLIANESGLIGEVERWFQYREARSQTSHAYDESKANMVYEVLSSFSEQASFLIDEMTYRLEKKS